jgi:uncharacterized protein YdaU (DUF1376 family)
MPLYTGDIERDTMHLGPAEYGIYMRLIIHAWQHNGAIPLDQRKLCNITRCDPRFWWRFGKPVVEQFFDAVDGSTATHKRVLTELRRSDELSNRNRAKALQRHSSGTAPAQLRHTQSQSHKNKKGWTGNGGAVKAAQNVKVGDTIGGYVWNGSRWADAAVTAAEADKL